MKLELLDGLFAVCSLPPDEAVPEWASGSFVSLVRSSDELSVVCAQELVPAGIRTERDWRCLRVAGELDFGMVGVLAGLTGELALVQIPVFVVSSFATDWLLVRSRDLQRALAALAAAGHTIG